MSEEIVKIEDAQLSVEKKLAELNPRLPIKYKNGMVNLDSIDEAFRFAQCALLSGLVPTSFKNAQSIILAMQYGAEIGLKPMQSLQNIAVINGKPGLYGKALPAVVQATGLLLDFQEHWEGKAGTDDWTAICHIKRCGKGPEKIQERTERFSWAQARKAGLDKKAGPWQQYPDLMLRYRARGLAFNALFADCLCGLGMVEELQDYPVRRPDAIEGESDPVLDVK